jgi:5-formyltetrahydrofolate cyclo-ligase
MTAGDKQPHRERVWDLLEEAGVARFPGAQGRIPNFEGATQAAERLAERPEWQGARTLKANPDMPQLPVRARALAEDKLVYLAVPKLAKQPPFLLLDPARISGPPRRSASIKGASKAGRPVDLDDMAPIDLIVCGTVAVNRKGVRIGKGGGFSDLELALAVEAGLVDDDTVIVTTVHPLQVVDGDLPETAHDFRVDLIVTPDEVIECRRTGRPPGILWDHLDDEKIAEVPALYARRRG